MRPNATLLHELAVDDEIEAGCISRVYMLALPGLNNLGNNPVIGYPFESIRLGAFSKCDLRAFEKLIAANDLKADLDSDGQLTEIDWLMIQEYAKEPK